MAPVRPVLAFLVLLAACNGGGSDSPDAGGPPAGWTCAPGDSGDGVVCHCACGAPDPDCETSQKIVSGCVNNQVCTPAGTCTDCGDGQLDNGEQCDPGLPAKAECGPLGYEPGQVGCNTECKWAYDQCTPLLTCGNGMVDGSELCDGSNIKAGLDCTDYGRTSGTLSCGGMCMINTTGCYTCGDGKVEGIEACDDHDASGGDGCSAACAVETGWQCANVPSQCSPKCGDGMRVGNEACDDGNANSFDGCSASCTIETDCTCSGTPSVCSCATTQLITTTTQSIDTGSLALDGNGQPHAIYYYGVNYTDPVTNYSMEHAHAMYASRPTTSWTTNEFATWDQTQTVIDPSDFSLWFDAGTLRAYFHRIYNTNMTFGVAEKSGSSWSFNYGTQYYNYDVSRAAGNWHALSAASGFADYHYYMGAPGNWTRDEPLSGIGNGYALKLAATTTGDPYITTVYPASGHTSYNLKLWKRLNGTTWAPVYDVATTGTCVYPISHEPLALANGQIMAFEEGFNTTQRWLKAHVFNGTSWVTETVADLSWLSGWTCSAGGASWTMLRMVSAVDQNGNPHILYPSMPANNSLTFEDHYRDATGWHVRTFPFTKGTPLDMVIDAQGTTHILAIAPSSTPSTTRIVYIRISQSAW